MEKLWGDVRSGNDHRLEREGIYVRHKVQKLKRMEMVEICSEFERLRQGPPSITGAGTRGERRNLD